MDSQDLRDLIPAYTLGALDPADAAAIEAAMAHAPELRAEVERYRLVVADLAFAALPVAPPEHVRERLLSRVAADSTVLSEPGSSEAPVAPAPLRLPTRRRWPWAQLAAVIIAALLCAGLGSALATTSAQLQATRAENVQLAEQLDTARRDIDQLQQNQQALGTQLEQARQNQERLAADLSRSRARLAQVQQQLETESQLVSFLGNPRLAVRGLRATSDAPGASGTMYMEPGVRTAAVLVSGLPPLPAGETYQFWLATGRSQLQFNGGVLEPADDGTAQLLLQAPVPVDQFEAVMVTVEQSTQRVMIPGKTTVLLGAL